MEIEKSEFDLFGWFHFISLTLLSLLELSIFFVLEDMGTEEEFVIFGIFMICRAFYQFVNSPLLDFTWSKHKAFSFQQKLTLINYMSILTKYIKTHTVYEQILYM